VAADLHIHTMDGVTEEDLKCFFSGTLGSRWCTFPARRRCPGALCTHWEAVGKSPNVWVGEVSWLSASLTGDDSSIPEPVQAVKDVIGESLPVLDDDLKVKILRALGETNTRAPGYDTTKDEGIVGWLDEHMGQRLFTVSW